MEKGSLFSEYLNYTAGTRANDPAPVPTNGQSAFDSLASVQSYQNPQQIFVDAINGNDTTGLGSELRPFQSLSAALAATNVTQATIWVLAPGTYNGAAIALPPQISIQGDLSSTFIANDVSFTAVAAENINISIAGIKFTSTVVIDLTNATLGGTIGFLDCVVNLQRLDGNVDFGIFITNCIIDSLATAGTIQIYSCQILGNMAVTGGDLILYNTLLVGVATITAPATMTFFSCLVPAGEGSIAGVSNPTVNVDASTFFAGFSNSGVTINLIDKAPNLGYNPAVPANWLTPPTQVAQALDELSASSAANPLSQVVFQPGGTAAGNVYTTWTTAYNAAFASSNAGNPTTLYIDNTFGSASVDPGTYNLLNITLSGSLATPNGISELLVPDGVAFTNFNSVENYLFIVFSNTTAPIETVTNNRIIELHNFVQIRADGSMPVWSIGSSGVDISCFNFAEINGSTVAVAIQSGFQLEIDLNSNSDFGENNLSGDATTNVKFAYDDSSSYQTQAGFLGSLNGSLNSQANAVAYDPATPANWTTPPTQVAQALDELAAQSGPGAFTSGSVPFAGSTGALTQDNANLFWNETDKTLGIGTNSPMPGYSIDAAGNIFSGGTIVGQEFNNDGNGFNVDGSGNVDAHSLTTPGNPSSLDGGDFTTDGNGNLTAASYTGPLEYAPAVPANWPVPPTTAQQALDDLAATANTLNPGKETITLTGAQITAQSVTLAHLVTPNSLVLLWNAGQPPLETIDYTLATIGGVTVLSFVSGGILNTFAASGQILQPSYLY